MGNPDIKIERDLPALAHEAAERISASAGRAIERQGRFSIALSGGSTPRPVYELLATEPFRTRIDWDKVEIYFGDERCVPPDSDQSNYRMAREAMLDRLPLPPANIHRIRGEIEPNEAAAEYGQLLKRKFADGGGLDLVLLGMGPDGHTASLFPGTEALRESHHRCVANFVPKFSAWRITMTAPFINRSGEVLFLIAGADKAQRVADVLEGPPDSDRLPSQLIRPAMGRLAFLMDVAAAGMI